MNMQHKTKIVYVGDKFINNKHEGITYMVYSQKDSTEDGPFALLVFQDNIIDCVNNYNCTGFTYIGSQKDNLEDLQLFLEEKGFEKV